MKSSISKFGNAIDLAIVAAALFAFIAVASPAFSYGDSKNPNTEAYVEISADERFEDRFEAHTKILHDKLEIAPQQESLWNNLSLVMRENAKTMEALIISRANNDKDIMALDDLKSYYEIASAHAEGLKKFIPAFEALYDSMSNEQQKNANILFQSQRQKMIINKASSK